MNEVVEIVEGTASDGKLSRSTSDSAPPETVYHAIDCLLGNGPRRCELDPGDREESVHTVHARVRDPWARIEGFRPTGSRW